MLSPQQQALLGLLNANSDSDFLVLSADDWEMVLKESIKQAVTIQAFDCAEKHKQIIPRSTYKSWFDLCMQYFINNSKVLTAQNNLIKILDDNKFSYIILKGLSSASFYPDPKKRLLGDVDFLICPEQQKAVEDALINAGYKKELDEHICHRVFKKPHEHLEMHFEVAGIPHGKAGELFRDFLKNATQKFEQHETPSFKKPLPKFHCVIIFLHTIHHLLGEGLGLRHLCDWAYFVDKTHKEPFWETDILPLFKRSGTLNFASIITKTAHIYLGTACPEWARRVDDSLCEEVISDIFASGNLGHKDKDRAGSAKMISQHGKSGTKNGKIKNQYLTLINSMYYLYPFLHKWKILYPIIFIWRIIRYLILMFIGKKPSLIKANAYANQRLALYKQFKLYESTEE
ncbi:MAG: hypothetical protein E7542_03165 [Ruminococcaceae bacterium]|nr:hypothetical protein [Oscillospiraceae bacterium]